MGGRQADLYLDGADEAVLTVPLQHEPKPGYVGFTSGVAPGVREGVIAGNFANLVVRPGAAMVKAKKMMASEDDAPLLKKWQVSSPFPTADGMPERMLSDDFQQMLQWKTLTPDTNGVVNLTRYLGSPGEEGMTALAEVEIWSEREQRKKLKFGYSDNITVYLNELPLFSGINGYSSRYPRYLGNGDGGLRRGLPAAAQGLEQADAGSIGGLGWLGVCLLAGRHGRDRSEVGGEPTSCWLGDASGGSGNLWRDFLRRQSTHT